MIIVVISCSGTRYGGKRGDLGKSEIKVQDPFENEGSIESAGVIGEVEGDGLFHGDRELEIDFHAIVREMIHHSLSRGIQQKERRFNGNEKERTYESEELPCEITLPFGYDDTTPVIHDRNHVLIRASFMNA